MPAPRMSATYDFREIEPRWQQRWEQQHAFRAANPGELGGDRPKFFVLDFFPYPSGAGLHVGHPLGYIASDIIARYRRMRGFNVLHPMGWDAFGLPAEQYAVETGVHPSITTRKNIETFKGQLRRIGLGYDWAREFATCDESYYRWTQWIFLKIFNSWYDPECRWTDRGGRQVLGRARPIDELPIPPELRARGASEVEAFRAQHRLAYLAEVPVNWCPALGTVLANEEVTNEGRSERGDHPVFRRPMRQWMLRITEYADRLLADLHGLDWPEPIKLMQRNWIGRSDGAYVNFALDGDAGARGDTIRVFTTRPDTLFGATYVVLAPEHRLVNVVTTAEQQTEVTAYIEAAKRKSDLDRTADTKAKTGVFTGAHAINPVNHRRIPIWVADYVLVSYGTGSIMAVPGSDVRDLEFAEKFNLPVIQVVQPPAGGAGSQPVGWRGFEGDGVAMNSPPSHGQERFEGQCEINGLPTPEAKRRIIAWLEQCDLGEGTIQYKLRDWLFSRQRYWGEPFPIIYDAEGIAYALDESELPLTLPPMDDFKPVASNDPHAEPQTPLSRAREWTYLTRDGRVFRRELNTMPQWAGSCWYYLRFCDPRNDRAYVAPDVERYWMGGRNAEGTPKVGGVDLYMGGAEHAVLHLLYARFWHKVLYDLGHASTPEPFDKLFNQGMITAYAYRDSRGVPVHYDDIEFRDDAAFATATGEKLSASVEKMSKTLKNVVNPDRIIEEYGADTLRLYEMYMGPLEASKPWNTRDIIGVHRFLQRVWRLIVESDADAADGRASRGHSVDGAPGDGSDPRDAAPRGNGDSFGDDAADGAWRLSARISDRRSEPLERLLHKTIKKVQGDIERFAYNTAIAQMIVFVNDAAKADAIGRDQLERFLRVLAPFAPHICDELWLRLGHGDSIAQAGWPAYDEALTRDDEVEIAVQVNGKLRGRVMIPADADDAAATRAALAVDAVAREIAGRTPKKTIVVKGRLVNVIA
ncbi:MAG: leucine--tRNA ligase [Phycisphaerae bacterium]